MSAEYYDEFQGKENPNYKTHLTTRARNVPRSKVVRFVRLPSSVGMVPFKNEL